MVITQTLIDLPPAAPSHPAKYTQALLVTMAKMLAGRQRILDPFGGQGGIFQLEHWLPNARFDAVEIEPEWAAKHPKTTLGNALALPWADDTFDAICTSPAYGNRMADKTFDSPSGNAWMTYACQIGRELHPDNGGALQWGPKYRDFHQQVWTEARRVLVEGGTFVLNIKDHIRAGALQPVTDWHIECLESLGFALVEHRKIDTPAMRFGRNGELRVPYESVICFTLERKP